MFTGIIEEIGKLRILSMVKILGAYYCCKKVLENTQLGDSIAVNGICLTVTSMGADYFTADVMAETMRRTNLGTQTTGSAVNLERALMPASRMGGHIVSGHIDGTGTITSYEKRTTQRGLLLTQTTVF